MSRRFHTSMRIAFLVALFTLGAFAQNGRYLVKVTGDVNGLARRYGLTVVKSLTGSASGQHVLSSKGVSPQTVLNSLSREFAVQRAETDKPVRLPGFHSSALHPGAPAAAPRVTSTLIRYHNSYASSAYVNQPATNLIRLDEGQKLATGAGIVATIDTGVDFTHSVLKGVLVQGWDFVHNQASSQEQADLNQETTPILDQETTPILDQETTPILDGGSAIILQQETTPILDQETTPILDSKKYPAYGHGTMVAGLIHLVAPDALIMPVRAFASDGTATISQIVQAIRFAVDHGAKVLNMSFSAPPSPALSDAIDYAASKGVICVASAGNDNQANAPAYPAAYSSVIGVAATDNSSIRASFSNYGAPLVSLAAPGAGVYTIYPKEHYAQVWGTSFSGPLVAGAAALLVDLNSRTDGTLAAADLANATFIGQELGAGELNVQKACLAAKKK